MTAPDAETSLPLRRVLIVAFNFPPMAGSSGVQRPLSLVRYLPELGWQPIVLSAHPRAYERTADDLLSEIPPSTPVARTFALDAARHLRVLNRYPGFLARPDRWMSWYWSAVPAGIRLIREFKPSVIWSTYPIATAHLIGAELHARSGIPWIADFRDPMAQEGYPADPKTWRAFKQIEENAAARAARLVFVTPGAMRMYATRYPKTPRENLAVVENGYDEALFESAERQVNGSNRPRSGRVTLLHSGIVYPSERDPTALFGALGRLRKRGRIDARSFRILFRAPLHEDLLVDLGRKYEVSDLVEIGPPIPYRDALAEMMSADGLVIMQADNCNEQIPAKLYEYLRARRPILGLADPVGDTAQAMRAAGVRHIAKLEDSNAVETALDQFVRSIGEGNAALPDESAILAASRESRMREIAALLDRVALR